MCALTFRATQSRRDVIDSQVPAVFLAQRDGEQQRTVAAPAADTLKAGSGAHQIVKCSRLVHATRDKERTMNMQAAYDESRSHGLRYLATNA
jgi:hypothetical protein